MTTLAVHFDLSEEARKRIGIDSGNVPATAQVATFAFGEATPEERAAILACPTSKFDQQDNIQMHIRQVIGREWSSTRNYPLDTDKITLAEVAGHASRMSSEMYTARVKYYSEYIATCVKVWRKAIDSKETREPGAYVSTADVREIDALGLDLSEYRAAQEEWRSARPIWMARKAEADARREAYETEQKEEAKRKAASEAIAKDAWIEAHGSDHLKRARAAGHDAGRLYLIERAAMEFPGFVLDYEDHAEWQPRSCPTIARLDKRDEILAAHPEVEATIVWLTDYPRMRPVRDYEDYEDCEKHEALVVISPTFKHPLVF